MSLFTIPVYITPPTLPDGQCWTETPQELVNLIFAAIQAQMETTVNPGFFNQGSDVPEIDNRIYPWLRDAGDYLDGWFTYSGTYSGWIRPHRIPASANERMIWKGTEADLWAYDGGDGEDPAVHAPTAATGAMWVRDTDFDFRFPVGIGTNPTGYDGVNTSLAVGATGGEEKHALTEDENAPHTHDILQWDGPVGGATGQAMLRVLTTPAAYSPNYVTENSGGDPLDGNSPVAHNNMPPYRAVIFAKRSARVYYRI